MKLCKDCKYYKKSEEYVGYSTCSSPQAHATSPSFLANGLGTYADIMRYQDKACGLEGKLFEPRIDFEDQPIVGKWWEFWK